MNLPSSIIIRIEKLAFEGPGVGHFEEKAVFIPYALPGDLIEAEIIKDKGAYAEGRIIKIMEPSPQRTEAPCPYFFHCGGCQWMHLTYEEQLRWKARLFLETLQKIGGICLEKSVPVIPSAPFGYRNRIRLKAVRKKGGLLLGYYRAASHEIIDIKACLIADKLLNAALPELRDLVIKALPERETFDVELVKGEDEGLLCSIISKNVENLSFLRNYLPKIMGREKVIQGMTLQDDRGNEFTIRGKDAVLYSYRHPRGGVINYQFSPATFSQVSYAQNNKLVDFVLSCLTGEHYKQAIDLYCGMGNLTLPISMEIEKVTGIEMATIAVKWAILNARNNKIKNCSFWQMEAREGLSFLSKKGTYPALVVLDPPRSGAREVVSEMAGLGQGLVKKIIYISCNPATLARDVKILHSAGFQFEEVTLIDMFPQSYHMEIAASLVPISS